MSKQHGNPTNIGDDLRSEVEAYLAQKKKSQPESPANSSSGGSSSQNGVIGSTDDDDILSWAKPIPRATTPNLDNPHPGVPVPPLEQAPIPEAAKHVIGANPFTAIAQDLFPTSKDGKTGLPKTPNYNKIGKNPFSEVQDSLNPNTPEKAAKAQQKSEAKAAEASYWNLPIQFLQEIPKSVYATIGNIVKSNINQLKEKPDFADVHEDDTDENLATKYLNGMLSIVRNTKSTDIMNPVSSLIERITKSAQPPEQKKEAIVALQKVGGFFESHTAEMNKWQAANPVPEGFVSNFTKGVAGMIPDIALASLGTSGKGAAAEKYIAGLTEKAPAVVAKYAPKAAAFMERAVAAPFTKVMAGKGAVEEAANGEGRTDKNLIMGALKGGGEGIYMHTLGEAAGAASPYIARLLGKTNLSSAVSTMIANPLANMGVFTAGKTARTLATEGRLPTEEEVAHEAAMGLGFSLLHARSLYKTHRAADRFYKEALTDDPLQSLGRVLNDEYDNVARSYDPNADIASLKSARNELHKAMKLEPDLEVKRALGDQAIKIQDQLDAHDAVSGIISDPKAVVNLITSLPLSDDMKLSYIDQAGKIYKAFNVREQKIQQLAAEVKQHEEAAKQYEEAAKTSTDPIESISHEASAEAAKKAAEETKAALKDALKEEAEVPTEEKPAKEVEKQKDDLLAEFESGLDALKKPDAPAPAAPAPAKPTSKEPVIYSPNIVNGGKAYTSDKHVEGASVYELHKRADGNYDVHISGEQSSQQSALSNPGEIIRNMFGDVTGGGKEAKSVQTLKPAVVSIVNGKTEIVSKGEVGFDGAKPKAAETKPAAPALSEMSDADLGKKVDSLKESIKSVNPEMKTFIASMNSDLEKYEKELQSRKSAAPEPSKNEKPAAPAEITSMKVAEIKTDEKRFQNRDALDQGRVDDIANNFDANKFDPITVMPDGTVLSGHHRFAVAKKLGMEDVPVKVFQGTEAEAKDFARDSNTLGKQETVTERAKRYRELRESGKSEKDIAEMARQAHGSEATKVLNISRLDPKGKAIFTIKQFENSTDTDTKNKTQALGDWIGNVKAKHPDISRRQENEMFDHLQTAYATKKGAGKISSKSQFTDLADALINRLKDRGDFKEDAVLNFRNQIGKTGIELEYDAALEEAKQQLADAEKELGDKRAEFLSRGATKEELDRAIPKFEEKIQVALKNLEEIRKSKGIVADAVKRQQSIFDTIDNTPADEKQELDNNVSAAINPEIEEPGQSGTDSEQSPSKSEEQPKSKPEVSTSLDLTYDSSGDTEANMTETGSKTPQKKLLKALTVYSKSLAQKLGLEHDKDKKGKLRIAYVGHGDSSITLWKPNSDQGVYISLGFDMDLGNDEIGDYGNDKVTLSPRLMWRTATKDGKSGSNNWEKSDISVDDLAKKIDRELGYVAPKKEEPKSKPEPEVEEAEPVLDEKAQLDKDIADALRDFAKSMGKALNAAGLNTEMLEKGMKLIGLYTKKGLFTFKEMVADAHSMFGDIKAIIDGMKAAYSAHYSQAEDAVADKMTDPKELRKFDYDKFIEENGRRSEPNAVDENTPAVSTRQQTGTTEGNVQDQNPGGVSTTPNDSGNKTGNAVKQEGKSDTGGNRPSGNGNDTSTGRSTTGEGSGTDAGTRVQKDIPKPKLKPEDQNHVIKPADIIVPKGEVGKFTANLDAIFLSKKLESENRNPTPAEKQQLAQFIGWGGLAKYLNVNPYDETSKAFDLALTGDSAYLYVPGKGREYIDFSNSGPLDLTEFKSAQEAVEHVRSLLAAQGITASLDQLRPSLAKALLSKDEYQSAIKSTTSAHFTDRRIIKGLWDIAARLGFKGGSVLESSAGIGHIFGLMPKELSGKSRLTGYELEQTTGNMLARLYPEAKITVGGFENSKVPLNSVDLAITNVPFGKQPPYDKANQELTKFSLHNYFIGKNLKTLKPGGLGIMITSSSTMDAPASTKFREWVTSPSGGNSFLVGAIRLPNNAFSENAGTQVTSDILVFQKRGDNHDSSLEQPFRYTKEYARGEDYYGEEVGLDVNEYYHANPENMLGDVMTAHEAGSGSLHGNTGAMTLKAKPGADIEKAIQKIIKTLPEKITETKAATKEVEEVEEAPDQKEGSLFLKGGKVHSVENGIGVPVTLSAKKADQATRFIGMRDDLNNLMKLERTTVGESQEIEDIRKALNEKYDAYVAKHGGINGRSSNFLDDLDSDFPMVTSIETVSRKLVVEEGKKDKRVQVFAKAGILDHRINYPRTEPTHAANINDAMDIALNFKSALNLEYMGQLLGREPDDIKRELLTNNLAFENPDTGMLELPDQYLSGFVREKLAKAKAAAANDPTFRRNVAELESVIPENIPAELISYSIGAAWVPGEVYDGFMSEHFKVDTRVKFLEATGKFTVDVVGGAYRAENKDTYAVGKKTAVDIFTATLNNTQMVIIETIDKKPVKNVKLTAAAQAMQAQFQDMFQAWVRANDHVKTQTEEIYNNRFNGQVERKHRAPSFKHYPGANVDIVLRLHQKTAVSRGLAESTLFAHDVGTGKTFTMITTAMEMRRLGTARKPMIVVQNATKGQFVASFKKLYPGARILAPSKKEMAAAGRKRLFAKIATGDWDAVIIPQSQFTRIPDDPEREKAYIKEQIDEMMEAMQGMDKGSNYALSRQMEATLKKMESELESVGVPKKKGGKSTAKAMADKAAGIEAKMQQILDRETDDTMLFEETGIDALLVDEAHEYKRLGFQTSMQNIKGIDTSKSQKSQSVLLKSRWVQEKTGGKNVLFYTGTPISNTMAEAWTMMKYVRPDILEKIGITHFDQFAKTFGQVVPSLEQTGGGTFKIQSRFAKFQNLPELITAFRTATDVVLTEDVKEFMDGNMLPKLKDGKITQRIVKRSPELIKQIGEFKKTLEWFDELSGAEKKEFSYIPLVVYGKAKQASIDLRLLDPDNVDSPESKVNNVIANALEIYRNTTADSGTQMIFSDMYQSPEPKDRYLDEDEQVINPAFGKKRFNLFEDIKAKLIANGVPEREIAILTEDKYEVPERKEQLFEDMNAGIIRFALGTTPRMGVGVNAQDKMVALHHIDAPNRPMDFTQRNGRIVRQGNENEFVEVVAYGVEKTLDSSAYQRLATKSGFVNQLMKGKNVDRVMEDPADDSQMTFDEMMAQLSDSPYAMQKLLVDNNIRGEQMKYDNYRAKIVKTANSLAKTKEAMARNQRLLETAKQHAAIVDKSFPDGTITVVKIKGVDHADKFGEAIQPFIENLEKRMSASANHTAKDMITVNGIAVELTMKGEDIMDKKTHLLTKVSRLEYVIPEIGLDYDAFGSGIDVPSVSGTGLMSSMRSRIPNVTDEPAGYEKNINIQKEYIETLEKTVTEPFDDSKLKALTAESEVLKEKMLADDKKPTDDPDGGGEPIDAEEMSDADFIMDQENVKPALDFLDSLKIKGKKLYGMIVPIPPQLWNGAIEVMKTILKATNSAQKAIRVAAKYIERNGNKAQAKEFEDEINKIYGPGTKKAEELKSIATKLAESRADLKTKIEDINITDEPRKIKADLVAVLAEARKTNLIKKGTAHADIANTAIEKTAAIKDNITAAEAVEAVKDFLHNVGKNSMLKYAANAQQRLKGAYAKNKMAFTITAKQLMRLDPKGLTRAELDDYLELAPTLASQIEGMQPGMVSDVEIADFMDKVIARQEDTLKTKLIKRYKKLNLDNTMSVADMRKLIDEDKEARGKNKAAMSKSEFATRENKRREILKDILAINRDDLAKKVVPGESRKVVDALLNIDESKLGTSDLVRLNNVIGNIVANDRYTGAGYFSKVSEGLIQLKEYGEMIQRAGGGFRPITFESGLKNKAKGSNLKYLSLGDKYMHLNTFRKVGLATDNMLTAPINVGHSRQTQELNAVMGGLDNVIKKNGLQNDREAIYRVGVYGELAAYVVGGADPKVQFKNNLEMLRRTIEVLSESQNSHEKGVHKILSGIYDEISGAESIDELNSMLNDKHKAVYDYIQAVGKNNQGRLNDNNEAYGDKPMKEKANYVHRRYVPLRESTAKVDLVNDEPITMSANGMLGQAGTKQDVIARRNLPEGKYVDYNAYKSFRLGLNQTLNDIHTLGDRIKANYILNSPEFLKTLSVGNDSGKRNLRILKDGVQQMVNLQRGVARIDIDQDGVGKKIVNFFKQTFYGSAVGTVTAAVPQYASSVMFTLSTLKNPSAYIQALSLFSEGDNVFQQISGLFGGGKGTAKEFIKTASGGTANRDLQGDNELEDAMNNLSENVFGNTINPTIGKLFDALNSKFYASLKYGDRIVSLHTWLAGYIDNLIDEGVIKKASEFDLNMLKEHIKNPNSLAATNGETMVSLSNNESDSSRRATGFVAKTFGDELKIDWLYPVKKFAVNNNNKLWLGIRNLTEWDGGQADGLRMIMGSLASVAIYAAIREFILNKYVFDPAGKAVINALGMEDTDTEEQRRKKMTDEEYAHYKEDKRLFKFGVNLASDVILGGQNVLIEKGAENFANAMWKNFGDQIQKDAKEKKEFAPYDLFYANNKPSSMLGIYSNSPIGLVLDWQADERSPLAVLGDIFKESGESTGDEKARRALFSVGIPLATQFIIPSSDLNRINNRVKNQVENIDNLYKDITLHDKKNSRHKKPVDTSDDF